MFENLVKNLNYFYKVIFSSENKKKWGNFRRHVHVHEKKYFIFILFPTIQTYNRIF